MVYIMPKSVVEAGGVKHRVMDLTTDIPKGEMFDHVDQLPLGEREISYPGIRFAEAAWKIEEAGSGAAGTEPAHDVFYLAAAMKKTIVPATSVEYTTDGDIETDFTAIPTFSAFLGGGLQFDSTLMANNITWTLIPGEPMIASNEAAGLWALPAVAAPAAAFGTSARPVVCMNMSLSIGGWTPVIRNAEISLNMENNSERRDLNGLYGVQAPNQVKRRSQFKFLVEHPVPGTKDFDTEWFTQVKTAFAATLGTVAGNILNISADMFHAAYPKRSADGEILMLELLFDESEQTGDTKLTFLWT